MIGTPFFPGTAEIYIITSIISHIFRGRKGEWKIKKEIWG